MSKTGSEIQNALILTESSPAADVSERGQTAVRRIGAQTMQSVDGGAYTPLGASAEDAWFAATAARISTLVAALTSVVLKDDLFNKNEKWDSSVAGTGTVTNGVLSAVDLQNGTTAASNAVLTEKGSFNSNPNLRTTKSAIAFRIKKIANIATSDHRLGWSDGANPVFVGIQGATSQVNYSIKVGTGAIVDTGGVQSTTDYDTLILVNDGTSYYLDLNGATLASSIQAVGTAPATAGLAQILVTHNATANDGIRLDKVMIVAEPAS